MLKQQKKIEALKTQNGAKNYIIEDIFEKIYMEIARSSFNYTHSAVVVDYHKYHLRFVAYDLEKIFKKLGVEYAIFPNQGKVIFAYSEGETPAVSAGFRPRSKKTSVKLLSIEIASIAIKQHGEFDWMFFRWSIDTDDMSLKDLIEAAKEELKVGNDLSLYTHAYKHSKIKRFFRWLSIK